MIKRIIKRMFRFEVISFIGALYSLHACVVAFMTLSGRMDNVLLAIAMSKIGLRLAIIVDAMALAWCVLRKFREIRMEVIELDDDEADDENRNESPWG